MKTLILSFLMVIVSTISFSQNCFWAKGATIYSTDKNLLGVATDANGNVYLTGSFSTTTITFGSYTLTNHSNGTDDLYIVKYDLHGNVLWAKSAGGNIHDVGCSIAVDVNGDIYVGGFFRGDTIKFDTISLHNPNIGYSQVFLLKLNNNGNAIWAKTTGGSRSSDDYPYRVIVDGNNDIIMSGDFYSTSIAFESTVLYHNGTSGRDVFVAKYNSNGSIIWAKSYGGINDDNANDVTADNSNNIYFAGNFEYPGIIFGTDTMIGGTIIKLDQNGNFIWAKKEGIGISSAQGLTSDGTNIFAIGTFQEHSITFGNFILNNVNSYGNSNDIFIVKYSPAGDVVWANNIGGNLDESAAAISANSMGNVYITGYFQSDTLHFGNSVENIINTGQTSNYPETFIIGYDIDGNIIGKNSFTGSRNQGKRIILNETGQIIIAGYYESGMQFFVGNITLPSTSVRNLYVARGYLFSSAISTINNVSCNGFNNGSASLSLTGGMPPFTFSWSNGNNTSIADNLIAGNYSVTATDVNNCHLISSVTIIEPPADSARICMVTVDSISQHNIIFWDKTLFTTVDSFIVYREINTGNYQPVARLPFSAPSFFIDTVRHLYFPNTGDPNSGTFRYKLQVHDTCGGYSNYSPYHNTIYFLNNNGTFYWTTPYAIENGANPVSSYILMRDDNSTGNWHDVTSVAGTQQVMSDPLYVIYQNTASWRVKTQWGINCTQSKDIMNIGYSMSNIFTNNLVSVNKNLFNAAININPNPVKNELTIETNYSSEQKFEIINIVGQTVYSSVVGRKAIVDMSHFKSGIYFIKLYSDKSTVVQKIIKE